jgi:hypothetical protein
MADGPSSLLDRSATRYRELFLTTVVGGLWLFGWIYVGLPGVGYVERLLPWFVYGAALPMLSVLAGCAYRASRYARLAAQGDRAAAYDGWRLGRVTYGLFAVVVIGLLTLGLVALSGQIASRPHTIAGMAGAGLWGGWFLTAMRDQINLFGQAAAPDLPIGGRCEP